MITTQNLQFRKATHKDSEEIWKILQQAILRRKNDGSLQWQDGYPNPAIINNDIENGFGYVLVENEMAVGYYAIVLNDEPAYENIEGKWLTNQEFLVVHRVALSDEVLGKGYATEIFYWIEDFTKKQQIYSIKVDTNFDNAPMLHILDKLGYIYCGEVYFRGAPRKAFEKVLPK